MASSSSPSDSAAAHQQSSATTSTPSPAGGESSGIERWNNNEVTQIVVETEPDGHVCRYQSLAAIPGLSTWSQEEARLDHYLKNPGPAPAPAPQEQHLQPRETTIRNLLHENLGQIDYEAPDSYYMMQFQALPVKVGPVSNPKNFFVHENLLQLVPAFARLMEEAGVNADDPNPEMPIVDLCRDDPEAVARLFQFLYTGNFLSEGRPTTYENTANATPEYLEARALVSLYCLANDYDFDVILPAVLLEISKLDLTVGMFLELANFGYHRLHDEPDDFPFKVWARGYIQLNARAILASPDLNFFLENGAKFAVDLFWNANTAL